MDIPNDQITSFMLAMGLTHDQASQIHERAQRNNYTEELLNALYPDNVFLPGSARYSTLVNNYLHVRPVREAYKTSGSRARLNPSAVFAPNSTAQVASSVKILEFFQRQFAIRGRGYTMFPGMSGIEDGVLIALEDMADISLNPSHEVVSLGPGNHWGRVYEILQAEGVAVPGGEMAVVGISGFLTGNGIGPFLGSRGFSSSDVANYEVVTGGGKIVNANAAENADLWWALKGGSNNFGIVTRFDMNTFPLRDGVWSGTMSFNLSQMHTALGLFYDMETGPLLEDPHLTVTCMETFIPSIDLAVVELIGFTDKVDFTGTHPAAIQPILDAGPVSTTMSRKSLVESASENITPEFMKTYTARLNRANINVRVDKNLYQEISALLFSFYKGSTLPGHYIGMSFSPITPHTVRESNSKGGNPGGWQEISQNSVNFRSTWDNAANDAVAFRMDEEFMEKVTDMARKRNALMPNQWVNNAAHNADVMKTYGDENFQRLKAISDKYDEMKTFQKLCPGGYKLGA